MVDLRTVLAAVLGVALGVVLLVFPSAVVRAHRVGRLPHDHRGEYGSSSVPERWRRLVQVVGVGLLAAGLYFAAMAVGALPSG